METGELPGETRQSVNWEMQAKGSNWEQAKGCTGAARGGPAPRGNHRGSKHVPIGVSEAEGDPDAAVEPRSISTCHPVGARLCHQGDARAVVGGWTNIRRGRRCRRCRSRAAIRGAAFEV